MPIPGFPIHPADKHAAPTSPLLGFKPHTKRHGNIRAIEKPEMNPATQPNWPRFNRGANLEKHYIAYVLNPKTPREQNRRSHPSVSPYIQLDSLYDRVRRLLPKYNHRKPDSKRDRPIRHTAIPSDVKIHIRAIFGIGCRRAGGGPLRLAPDCPPRTANGLRPAPG